MASCYRVCSVGCVLVVVVGPPAEVARSCGRDELDALEAPQEGLCAQCARPSLVSW